MIYRLWPSAVVTGIPGRFLLTATGAVVDCTDEDGKPLPPESITQAWDHRWRARIVSGWTAATEEPAA